jgi:hypothetical protein
MSEHDSIAGSSAPTTFAALRRFARPRPPAERCELCSAALAPEHAHLVEPHTRQLLCSCDPCAILFSGRADSRFRRVPRRIVRLPDFVMADAQWDDLRLPINLAFFFHATSASRVVALYPSPAGAVESLLPLDAWGELVQVNPVLATIEPDVEALLVNRLGTSRGFVKPEHFIAPIDQCYALVGLLRTNWRGLSGGSEVWDAVRAFFEKLRGRAEPVRESREAPHA